MLLKSYIEMARIMATRLLSRYKMATTSRFVQEPILATQATYVNNYEWLPEGGTYDSTTGTTWYMLSDGNKWWMQEDGSFVLHQPEEVIAAENHVFTEERDMQ